MPCLHVLAPAFDDDQGCKTSVFQVLPYKKLGCKKNCRLMTNSSLRLQYYFPITLSPRFSRLIEELKSHISYDYPNKFLCLFDIGFLVVLYVFERY